MADPLWGYFSAVAGVDQQIDPEELSRCLTSSGIAGSYKRMCICILTNNDTKDISVAFSKETCRIMISMLDRDRSGTMGFNEFKELWTVLNQWKVNYWNVTMMMIVMMIQWLYSIANICNI